MRQGTTLAAAPTHIKGPTGFAPTAASRSELERLLADDVPHGDLTTDALGIGSVAGVVLLAVAAVVLLVWPGYLNKTTFDATRMAQDVQDGLISQGFVDIADMTSGVTCPGGHETDKVETFECTVVLDGTTRTITINTLGTEDANGAPQYNYSAPK